MCDDAPAFIFGFLVGALGFAIICMLSLEDPESLRREAVLRGKAEWYAHPATGEVQWRWKP